MKKKVLLVGPLVLVAIFFGFGSAYPQMMGPGMMGQWGYGGQYCPNCGQYVGPGRGPGMGPGMMGPGYGMGPGMMHRGWGMGPGMMGPGYGMGPGMMHHGWGMGPQYGRPYGPQYGQPPKPLEEKEAKELVENYVKSTRNPNLTLGKIKDAGSSFEAEIVTKDGSLADKIVVDKATGWMRSMY